MEELLWLIAQQWDHTLRATPSSSRRPSDKHLSPNSRGDCWSNCSHETNKATALDCAITVEALQGGGDQMLDVIRAFCSEVYTSLSPPRQWITNVIIPLPKKGDLSLMTNYRGISLMAIAAKVYNKILLNRIRPHVDPILRKIQVRFRPGRSCAQQIHILRRIMKGFKEYQLPLNVTFVDFKKAFDSINKTTMFSVLRHYGIPETTVNAIQVLYNSSSAVIVDGSISDPFDITKGVLQGDVLAPFLFIILVDYLLGKASGNDSGVVTCPRQSGIYSAKRLNDLNFADDITLLESSMSWAQSQLTRTADAAADLGPVISAPKTEFMTINCHPQPPLQVLIWNLHKSCDRLPIPWFHDGIQRQRPEETKSSSWKAFWKLERLWKSPSMLISTKVKLFNKTCITVWLRVLGHLQGHGEQNQFFWHVLLSNHVEHQANR